jgi:tellurite resistance protein TehA-like permease
VSVVPAENIRTLHPAYFAFVMATGIVSIAAQLLHIPVVPRLLLGINLVAFVVLWTLTIVRIGRYPKDVIADISDHQRGVGFFTAGAATSVLGSQLVIVANGERFAFAIRIATLILWLVLVYAVWWPRSRSRLWLRSSRLRPLMQSCCCS